MVDWSGATSSNQILILNGNSSSSGYAVLVDSNDNNELAILCGGKGWIKSDTQLTQGSWQLVTAIRENGTWSLYVDGVSVSITNNSLSPNTPDGGLYIGANNSGLACFNGMIDDVRVYEQPLDSSAVEALSNNALSSWRFNNSEQDSIGINNGLLIGNPVYTTDSYEGTHALDLDGTGDSISASLVTSEIDNITLSAWIKWSGSTGSNQSILLNGNSNQSGYGILLNANDNNELSVLCGGSGWVASDTQLTAGIWQHIAAVRRSGTWEMYLDGSSIALSNSNIAPNTPDSGTFIGANNAGSAGFNGLIDDVTIFEKALSAAEIVKLSN